MFEHFFWIVSRAAGCTALVCASLSVVVGLSIGSGALRRVFGKDVRVVHEALSLATIGALLIHAVSLLGDGFLRPSVADLTVPFVSDYETFWTSLGIVAGWSTVLLGLSYYARGRIGPQRWKRLHRYTALAWVLGLGHALGEGTDAGQTWFLAMTGIVAIPAAVLLAVRLLGAATSPAPSTPIERERHASIPTH
ncbi:MAG: ferric reductase-like transmembrane domain-containing protein [Solirubrobacteraceae bacterium]|nr:ferric reductase-like transmembrane domain-containing protein [Solirubrobacteraceae bacterium]